jgi:L-asparaginase II
MAAKVLARVIRGDVVESVHRGHYVMIDGNGRVVASAGSPKTVTFIRSAAKPFQALPFITSGAADAFGFSEEEVALACASHSGEARHVRIVELMLERIGLGEIHLRCGTHLPFFDKEAERMQRDGEYPTQLHNNCSGKHAAMLALAKHSEADITSYASPASPVQIAILKAVAKITGLPAAKIKTGVDGCAAPNFALPLTAMAQGFLNLVSPPESFDEKLRAAGARLVAAMKNFPELIGGSERLDTVLMQAAPGQIISKVGAEGVWLCGILPSDKYPAGLAIALKVEDGDDRRARPVIAVAILKTLGILSPETLPELSPMAVKNRRGDVVGRVEPVDI